MRLHLAFIALAFIFGQILSKESLPSPSLRSVQIIVRHGDRETDNSMENPTGQLTDRGKKRMFQFGLFLKERYPSFLEGPSAGTFILSSDRDRTIGSAQLIALGANKGNKSSIFHGNNFDRLIPIRTIPAEIDDIIQMKRPCPRFDVTKEMIDYAGVFVQKNKGFFRKYAGVTGNWDVFDAKTWPGSVNAFAIYQEEALHNISLGLPLNEVGREAVENPVLLMYKPGYNAVHVDTPEKQRLHMGPIFRKIVSEFEEGEENKMIIYSGHDLNLILLMITLEIWQTPTKMPPYGSALFVELHEAKQSMGQNYLEFWFKNDTGMHFLEVPNCGSPCVYENFKNRFEYILAGDFVMDCQI